MGERAMAMEMVTGMMRRRRWGPEGESEGRLALACNGHVPTRAESPRVPQSVSPFARMGLKLFPCRVGAEGHHLHAIVLTLPFLSTPLPSSAKFCLAQATRPSTLTFGPFLREGRRGLERPPVA